jgi:putative SOS response-associated peptidase YedK
LSLVRPFPADEMTAYPISTLVNSPKNDVAACIEASE